MYMEEKLIFAAGGTKASRFAVSYLQSLGLSVTDSPDSRTRYLLLDVPSFQSNGLLRSGGSIEPILSALPKDIMICGGNLSNPALDGYETVDFLKDEGYLCENAYITAECALDVALPYLGRTLRNCPVLVIGWGRIGKCLVGLLKNLGADVMVAVRNPKDKAMIHALGYSSVDITEMAPCLGHFRLLYNTVPCPVLDSEQLAACHPSCVKIELASKDGIVGDDIVIARGLPGLHMPESSGKLIADTFLRLCYGR
jgi:dipicolinate synthase subunit A